MKDLQSSLLLAIIIINITYIITNEDFILDRKFIEETKK